MNNVEQTINKYILALSVIAITLLVAHIGVVSFFDRGLSGLITEDHIAQHGLLATAMNLYFNLDVERNIPSWFGAGLHLSVAALVAVTVFLGKDIKNKGHWKFLIFAFLFLSLDETISIHEKLTGAMKMLDIFPKEMPYMWVYPVLVCVGIFALSYIKFLKDLPKDIMWKMVLAGGIFVTGAAVIEMIGGLLDNIGMKKSALYQAEVVLEEGMEMFGIILFISAINQFLSREVVPQNLPKLAGTLVANETAAQEAANDDYGYVKGSNIA